MKLQFLGATRQVTGSRYYLDAAGAKILIDCGMFQERHFRDRARFTDSGRAAFGDYVRLLEQIVDQTRRQV